MTQHNPKPIPEPLSPEPLRLTPSEFFEVVQVWKALEELYSSRRTPEKPEVKEYYPCSISNFEGSYGRLGGCYSTMEEAEAGLDRLRENLNGSSYKTFFILERVVG